MGTSQKSTQQLFPTSTCSQEDFLVSHFPLLEKEGDLTTQEEHCSLISQGYLKKKNQNIFYLKTLKDFFHMTLDELSKPLSPRLQNWGIAWNGKCLTQRISVSHKTGKGYSLSDILEKSPDKKYFLSKQQTERLLSLKPSEQGGGKSLTKKHAWNLIVTGGLQAHASTMKNCSTALTEAMGKGGGHTPIIQLNNPTHSNDRVYSDKGISPTLNTMQGGRRQPFIKIKEATKKGYTEAQVGDSINLSVPNSTTRRSRVGKGIAQTLDTGMQQYTLQERSIRRLTPLECERLMGLPDNWTAEGTEGKISDTQRYKMCGNGVVVNVVEEIIKKLLFNI